MVSIKVITERGIEDKKIPQSFDDLQWIDYVNALCTDDTTEAIEALTGISTKDFNEMSLESQSFIFNSCGFFWNEKPEYIEVPDEVKELSIEQGTWLQLINSEAEFKRVNELELPEIAASQLIIKTYTGVDIKGLRVPEALGYWAFFFCSLRNGKRGGKICTQTNQTTMRLPQGLKRYNSSDGSPLYTRLRKVTFSNTTQSLRRKQLTSTQPYYLKRRNGSIVRISNTSIQRLTNR
jgi:hypothetical protein